MSGITLESFRNLMGTVNDGQFIVQEKNGQMTLDRVNRGQYSITRALRWKQMKLTGEDQKEANELTRLTLLAAIIGSNKDRITSFAVESLRRTLGLDDDATKYSPLDVRTVKTLLDEIDEGRFDLLRTGEECDEYDNIVAGRFQGREESDVPDGNREQPAEGDTVAQQPVEEQSSPEHQPGEQPVKDDAPNSSGVVLEDESKRIEDESKRIEEERIAAERAHQKKLAELDAEIVSKRNALEQRLIGEGKQLVEALLKDVKTGKLLLYADVFDENAQDELIDVDGIVKLILETSLERNAVEYFADEVSRMVSHPDRFTSKEEGFFGADEKDEKDVDAAQQDIKERNDELERLNGEFSIDDVKPLIAKRLRAMLQAVKIASEAKCDFGADYQLAKAMREMGLPDDNDFYVFPNLIFANHQTRAGVEDLLRNFVASATAEFRQKFGVMTEDPELIDDFRKHVEDSAVELRKLTAGKLDASRFDVVEIRKVFEGVKNEAMKSINPRLDACRKRREARLEVMSRTGIVGRHQEIMTEYAGRLSKEATEKIANFCIEPPENVREMIDKAINEQIDRNNLGASDVGVKVKAELEKFVKAVVDQEREQAKKLFQEREGEFRVLADCYLTPGHREAFSSLEALRPLVDAKAEGQAGLEDGPAAERLAAIKEKAFEHACAKVVDKGFLPAEFASDEGKKTIGSAFRKGYQAAFFRMHHLMEFYDDCVQDKAFNSEVKRIGMSRFEAKVYLNEREKAVVNSCLAGVRMKFVLKGAAEEPRIDLGSGVAEASQNAFRDDLLRLLAEELRAAK